MSREIDLRRQNVAGHLLIFVCRTIVERIVDRRRDLLVDSIAAVWVIVRLLAKHAKLVDKSLRDKIISALGNESLQSVDHGAGDCLTTLDDAGKAPAWRMTVSDDVESMLIWISELRWTLFSSVA